MKVGLLLDSHAHRLARFVDAGQEEEGLGRRDRVQLAILRCHKPAIMQYGRDNHFDSLRGQKDNENERIESGGIESGGV